MASVRYARNIAVARKPAFSGETGEYEKFTETGTYRRVARVSAPRGGRRGDMMTQAPEKSERRVGRPGAGNGSIAANTASNATAVTGTGTGRRSLPAVTYKSGKENRSGKMPFDAAEIERQGLLMREVSMRKERNKIRRRYILMILVSFLFSIALIYRYSYVIEINEQILREKTTLANLQNENSLLQKQIGIETDLEKIRLLAESKLDMQKPDKDQIVYIKVPRKDHALLAAPEKTDGSSDINIIEYIIEQARLIQKRILE